MLSVRTWLTFRGTYVAVAGFCYMALPYAVVLVAHAVFLTPVCQANGFTTAQFSMVYTLTALSIALTSPYMGRLLGRAPLRLVMTVCAIVTSICFFAFGLARRLWQFYALAVLMGVSVTGVTQLPVSMMVTNWFAEKKGLVTGLVFAGGSVGGFGMMRVVSHLIVSYGYQRCYFLLGLLVMAVTVPLSLFVVCRSPQEVGARPFGQPQDASPAPTTGWTHAQAKKTAAYWLFIAGMALLGTVCAGVQMHIPAALQSYGYSLRQAAHISSLLSLCSLLGNVLIGAMLDRLGPARGLWVVALGLSLSLVCLLYAQTVPVAYLFCALYGLFIPIGGMGPSYLSSELFGQRDYAAIFGFVNLFFLLGGAAGPLLSGLMADVYGSYRVAFWLYLGMLLLAFALITLALRKRQPPRD